MKEITTCKSALVKHNKPVQRPISKIGGLPVFFDKIEWPKCGFCGREMDFIGQFSLCEPLKLSTKYDIAYVFMCPGEFDEEGCLKCETWDHQSGGNAVIFQNEKDIFFSENHQQNIPDYILDFEMTKEPLIDFSNYDIDEEVRDRVVMTTKNLRSAWLKKAVMLHLLSKAKSR